MPRKATPQSPEVITAIERIASFCVQTKMNINGLSARVGVQQSALWLFMNGDRKTITNAANKTLKYIDSWHKRHNPNKDQDASDDSAYSQNLIEDAAMSLWDGNAQTAVLIASLIRALKPALDVVVASNPSSSQK